MENERIEITDEVTCTACMTIPVSHLQLEVEVPISGSWQAVFDEMGIKTVIDTAGRTAISTLAARRLFAARKRRDQLAAEDHDRRSKEMAARHPVKAGGLPAIEGASPLESLAASPGYQLPSDEFQGTPRPRFLEEQLAEGARQTAEKKREAEEKRRLAASMTDRLR